MDTGARCRKVPGTCVVCGHKRRVPYGHLRLGKPAGVCPTKTIAVIHLSTTTFWLPKAGNSTAEYEDAFLAGKRARFSIRTAFAVADGATESLLSGNWANLLVKRFVRNWEEAETPAAWLTDTLRAWQKEKRAYLVRRERSRNPVQWYEEPGLEAGAFAALLGLILTELDDAGCMIWHAFAVGDCCLFHIRGDGLLCAFPVEESQDLNNRPFLLSSNPARNAGITGRFRFAGGEALPGDRFYLMSDALAGWFLRAHEQGTAPWEDLDLFCARRVKHTPGSEDAEHAFAGWIEEQRAAHTMRNDDVTLIRVELQSDFVHRGC